ncbi:hypothetical protein Lal_00021351 [Lupinus albus]|nr:hypothetical protein Lal_00021351 [Lupinus albus]
MVFDHYVAVACWTPEFVAPTTKVDRTMVWIRFPGLNMVYYDESFLLGLASCVGKPIKVDTNTLRADMGRYARVCVEIDLTKLVTVVSAIVSTVTGNNGGGVTGVLGLESLAVDDSTTGHNGVPQSEEENYGE